MIKWRYSFTLVCALATLTTGCRSKAPKADGEFAAAGSDPKGGAPGKNSGDAEANLTQKEAADRFAQATNIKYWLKLRVDAGKDVFRARAKIDFTAAAAPKGLFLDFKDGATIKKVIINGKTLEKLTYSHNRITLPDETLKVGANKVDVTYAQGFSNNGRGLHHFEDPEDKKVYLYTQFEAFDAHQMFPCFDQPDMKGTMTLKVSVPTDWSVITTTREDDRKIDEGNILWEFPETPKISTYLFSLHAGPYHVWESRAEGNIHLRLFSRESLAKFINPRDWFLPTQQGLKFYGEEFGYPYPFKKYDQVIAPDFNAGAMENVAAVTFSEHFVNRGKVTREDKEDLASVILHEMAHMWFGDLVTMKWWNGLWLNESFATFMSSNSMFKATDFKEAWTSFYSHEKSWAYWEDQLVTTHPIEGDVPDVASAFTRFDGITYGKGASVLKQLNYYLGERNFRNGVRRYFKKYAFSNTSIDDFIGSLAASADKDLKPWADTWLRQAGLDSVSAEYECKDQKIASFALKLKGPDGKTSPRTHRTLVTLYKKSKGKIVTAKSQSVEYSGDSTAVKEFVGRDCPEMVYPNDQDQDYVKVQLDKNTLAALKAGEMNLIEAPFSRTLYWQNLYQMVRDSELAPQDYLGIVYSNYPGENDLKTAQEMTERLSSVFYYLPVDTADQKTMRDRWVSAFENLFWTRIHAKGVKGDAQIEAVERFVDTVMSQEGRDRLAGILEGKIEIKGFDLDVDHRSAMVFKLSALGDSRAAGFIDQMKESDKSERGVQQVMAAQAVQPLANVKREWFDKVSKTADMPFARQRAALRNIMPFWQDELRRGLAPVYFSELPRLAKTRESEFLGLFTSAFVPVNCSAQSVADLASFIKRVESDVPPVVLKRLRVSHQEDERCVNVRKAAATQPMQGPPAPRTEKAAESTGTKAEAAPAAPAAPAKKEEAPKASEKATEKPATDKPEAAAAPEAKDAAKPEAPVEAPKNATPPPAKTESTKGN